MGVIDTSPFARKLNAFVALTEPELSLLKNLQSDPLAFPAHHDLIYQGQAKRSAYVLVSGWAFSYKNLFDGSRQIIDFQIPGDFLGLRNVLLNTADHNIECITKVQVSEIQADDLLNAFSENLRLATAVLWAASRDEAMVVEHLADIGRREATVRMAHFLLELGARLSLVGMGTKSGYTCPLSQFLLADALGLSAVHVNRVLRLLREKGLVTYRKGNVTYGDYDKLVDFAEFDPSYLDHDGPLLK